MQRAFRLRAGAAAFLASVVAVAAAPPLLGVEFTSVPAATCDLLPQALGPWTVASAARGGRPALPGRARRRDGGSSGAVPGAVGDSPARLDADGWPTEDAFVILFDATPDPDDPAAFVPSHVFGAYSIAFEGKAAGINVAPQMNATVTDVAFDPASWTTTATLTLQPPLPGVAIGLFGTQRDANAPVGSGVRRVRVLPPGAPADCRGPLRAAASAASSSSSQPPPPLFSPAVLAALAPFSHVRFMQWTFGYYVLNYTSPAQPGLGVALEWADRARLTDAIWQPALSRPKAFGAPWESVVLLSQATAKGVWINVPVQASDDYVAQLAALMRDGSVETGSAGLPAGAPIYLEHGNEVWLNGSTAAGGGPSATYAYNKAAAVAEVAANGSSILNSDGVNDPETWAYRRHLRRVCEIGAIFAAVFGGGGARPAVVRPVLGWTAAFPAELARLGAWYGAALAPAYGPLAAALYAVAINAYAVGGVLERPTLAQIVAAASSASDAARPARAAAAALAASGGLRLVSYEGALVVEPLARDAATTGEIIQANRSPGWGAAVLHDYAANWATIPNAGEFNFFALSSQYGQDYPIQRFQWGLTEDVANTSTPKFEAVRQIVGGARA